MDVVFHNLIPARYFTDRRIPTQIKLIYVSI